MFKFLKRIFGNKPGRTTTDSFAEAAKHYRGGPPETIPADGGSARNYVNEQLQLARQQALDDNVPVGGVFGYRLTNIPIESSPYEIMAGIMMQSHRYDLQPEVMHDEMCSFTRLA